MSTERTATLDPPAISQPGGSKPPSPQISKSNARQPLQKPEGVTHRIAWHYVIAISTMHALALFACVPWLFSWSGLIMCLIGTHLFGSGINIGYHRLLTHRSFQCNPTVERLFVVLALCCFEDTPATWVATHRLHHRDSDERPDPHTPLVN